MALLFCLIVALSSLCLAAIHQGNTGQDVRDVQTRLNALGYAIKVDGIFGLDTSKAVKKFQVQHGLEVDGVVGQDTYRALMDRDIPVSRSDEETAKARRLMSYALRYTGTPYVFGGTQPTGFDCSGYVQFVFNKLGVALPRCADEQYTVGKSVDKSELKFGDLVFFETYAPGASHVGIYIGENEFVAASSSQGITVSSLSNAYYAPRYVGARRIASFSETMLRAAINQPGQTSIKKSELVPREK